MRTKEIRPTLDPETCAVCGRRLLQGEMQTRFVAPDGTRHVVCELCIPRADRARWVRERDGEQPLGPRPPAQRRAGSFRRMIDWFGGAQPGRAEEDDELAFEAAVPPPEDAEPGIQAQPRGRERRSRLPNLNVPQPGFSQKGRQPRGEQPSQPKPAQPLVTAVPTDEEAKLQRGLELFNHSQFPRTIAGLTRSLGLPQVAILHAGGNSVEIFVAWGISWYSYRVDLGDATEPVELSGRGNDSAELAGVVGDWNVIVDEGGVLVLKLADAAPEPAKTEAEEPATQPPVGPTEEEEA